MGNVQLAFPVFQEEYKRLLSKVHEQSYTSKNHVKNWCDLPDKIQIYHMNARKILTQGPASMPTWPHHFQLATLTVIFWIYLSSKCVDQYY